MTIEARIREWAHGPAAKLSNAVAIDLALEGAGEIDRLKHIIAVMKGHVAFAAEAVASAESRVRFEGRLQVWSCDDWVNVADAEAEYKEITEGTDE